MPDQDEKCYACGRAFNGEQNRTLVTPADDQLVYVGPECHRKIKAAGVAGYQPPRGGPRLYLIEFKP